MAAEELVCRRNEGNMSRMRCMLGGSLEVVESEWKWGCKSACARVDFGGRMRRWSCARPRHSRAWPSCSCPGRCKAIRICYGHCAELRSTGVG